jgi:hypothetical protein
MKLQDVSLFVQRKSGMVVRNGWIITAVGLLTLLSGPAGLQRAMPCSMCRSGDDRFFLNGASRINTGGLIVMAEFFSSRKTSGMPADHHKGHLERAHHPPSILHEHGGVETHTQQTVRALLLYGVTERLTLLGVLPYAFNTITEGGLSESSRGFADPELTAIVEMLESDEGTFEMNASLGVRFPLGEGEMTDGNGVLLDQHLQSGTGAWGMTAGLQGAHVALPVPLFYSASYQVNGVNSHEFRYGNVLRANIATQWQFARDVRLLVEGNFRFAERDMEGSSEDPNSGGTIVYFSPGLRISLPAGLALRGQAQIPVVEDLFGVQDEDVNVQVGLSMEF